MPGHRQEGVLRDRDIGTHRLIVGYNRLYGWKPTRRVS
jgi:hypothetical protein